MTLSVPNRFSLLALSLMGVLPTSAAYVVERSLASPDGAMVFTLERDDASQALLHSVTYAGRPVVSRGSLGVDISGTGVIGGEGTISGVASHKVDSPWTNPFGERSAVPDRYTEETLTISHPSQGSFGVKLQVRAYDEGIALRYLIEGSGTVVADNTSFPLSERSQVWVAETTQGEISKVPVAQMSACVSPVLAELESDLFAAVGEAGLSDGSRIGFARSGPSTLLARICGPMEFSGSLTSAWRFVRAAKSPGALLEGNHFVLNLCEPSKMADTSWIRPGKALREVTLTTQGSLACIDFAVAHKLQYIMFDAGWYGPEKSPSSDATKVTLDPARSPGPLDLPAVIAYAKKKGVGVILYVNQIALSRQLDEILPLYQSWGVAGIKFGFVHAGPQADTRWLHQAVAKCAEHRLMVDIHDDYRPTGTSRTYPNLLTQDEESPPNATVLNTIFTRGLVGAGDHTNCYFAPRVVKMGSHASQLAKAVCLFSPWQFLYWYDRPGGAPHVGGAGGSGPSLLEEVPELSFYDRLPTTWDETRVIDGYPGTHATIARRKGDIWFVAGLNGSTARAFKVPLGFLDPTKSYRAELFTDDPAMATSTQVRIDQRKADSKTTLELPVAASNGFAIILTP
jgi:alpha-glucosidase